MSKDAVTLNDICVRIGDGMHGTPTYDENGEYYFINGSNIVDGKIVINSDVKKVNYSEFVKHRRDLSKRTILLSINGTVGNVAMYRGEKCILGKSVAYLNIKDGVDSLFVYYVFRSREFREFLRNANGSTIKNVSLKMLNEYSFYLPKFDIQRKISCILSNIDRKIEINQSVNDNLSKQCQAIFVAMIVNGEVESKLKLTEIAHFQNGLPMQKNRPLNGIGLPVLKIKELNQGYCDESSERCREDIGQSVLIDDGDVVFSWSGSLMTKIWCGGRCGLNQHLFKVTSNKYPLWFYYNWLQYHMPDFIDIAANKATTMGHICRDHLEEAIVLCPSKSVMEKTDSILSPLYKEQINLMKESNQLCALRDYILPKLMSHEIDVSSLADSQLNNHLS